jgi:hypothetical protein
MAFTWGREKRFQELKEGLHLKAETRGGGQDLVDLTTQHFT